MKILVTGADGFIGHHLLKRLVQFEEHEIHPVIRVKNSWKKIAVAEKVATKSYWIADVGSWSQIHDVLNMVKPDVVFHLAANPIVKEDGIYPGMITEDNVLATHNMLTGCRPGTRFVFASSATIYGDPRTSRQKYGCGFIEADTPQPTSVYGVTKVASEAYVKYFSTHREIDGVTLRLVANVGTGSTHGLIHDCFRKLMSDSEKLELLGDKPGSSKPYIHVNDTVEAMIKTGLEMSAEEVRGQTFNVSTKEPVSVEQVALTMMGATGVKKEIHWLGEGANWKGDNRLVNVCSDKLLSTGWSPKHNSLSAVAEVSRKLMEEK